MSRVLKCDRCGCYADERDVSEKWRRIEIVRLITYKDLRSSCDLCENCKDQLFIFLGKKELK